MPGRVCRRLQQELTRRQSLWGTHLLRRSYREDGRVKNETLGNLSHLPESLIDVARLHADTMIHERRFHFR
jgi:hypothetical protein